MKRLFTIAVLLTVFVGVASASWWTWQVKPFGNAAGNTVRGAAADTLTWTAYVGTGGFRNVENFLFRIRADSVVDSLPNFTMYIQYKPNYLFGVNSWQAVGVVLDSMMPLDGSVVRTWADDTVKYFMPRIATFNACSVRAIITGKRAYQVGKACSLGWYMKK